MSTVWQNWDFDTAWQPEQNVKFLFVTEKKKNDFIEAVNQTSVDAQRRYVHSTLPRRFLSPVVDLIPRPTLLLCDL